VAALEVDTRLEQGVGVIALRGELDIAGAATLDAELDRVSRSPGLHALVVDLSRVEFMDSTGLRAVVVAGRRAGEAGVRFGLVRGGEPVQRVFDLTRMTERMTWVSSPAELTDGGEGA
jgi:anti-sigma B factor antagonist